MLEPLLCKILWLLLDNVLWFLTEIFWKQVFKIGDGLSAPLLIMLSVLGVRFHSGFFQEFSSVFYHSITRVSL